MNTDFVHPQIQHEGKRYAKPHHVVQHAGRPVAVIKRLVDSGDIAAHLINAVVYIDIDEALAVLSTSNSRPKTPAKALGGVDLFA
jgi:hypothetical protein